MFSQSNPTNAALPFAFCPSCRADVLLYADLGEAGDIVRRCLDCGGEVETAAADAGTWSIDEAVDAGYVVEGAQPRGAEGGGCSGGSCSGGSCGSGADPSSPG